LVRQDQDDRAVHRDRRGARDPRLPLARAAARLPRDRGLRLRVRDALDHHRLRHVLRPKDAPHPDGGERVVSGLGRLKLGFVSFGFLGLSPFAPGTAGTLGGVALAWGLARSEHYLAWSLLVCAGLYAAGRALGDWSERYAGGKDPGFFVVDEVI